MRWKQLGLACMVVGIVCCSLTMSGETAHSADGTATFSYSGDTGPGFWNDVNSACATTSTSRQSPINIDEVRVDSSLTTLRTQLQKSAFTVKNNGHTIVATPVTAGTLYLNGTTFTLLQFHFHTLSEHTIKGERSVMELHAVFGDGNGHYAVIGVLYRIGKSNPFLAQILSAGLPEKTTSSEVTLKDLDLSTAFTDLSRYYTYSGSLTTPPCSETVTWLLLRKQSELSASQFQEFQEVLGNDFRPLQAKNSRVVRSSPGS